MIDIIIPAYNCAKTLFKTLSSLEAQTDSDFKVIIVDDCSTEDLTPIIDSKRASLHITHIRKEVNEGCGMARQTGIDNATSEYITFLDADDILMPYAVETFNAMIVSNDFDIYHSYFYEQTRINEAPAIRLHKDGFTWCHGKLYKLDFIKKNNIRNSPEVKYADDSFFNSMCTELGTLSVIPLGMYIWMNNSDSITRNIDGSFKKDSLSDFINGMKKSTEFILQHKPLEEIQHLPNTVENIKRSYARLYNSLSQEEKDKTDNLIKEFSQLIKTEI